MSTTERRPCAHLSSAVVCPRRAAYQDFGVEETNPPDERMRRLFKRGHTVERVLLDEICEAYEARGLTVERQRRVRWPASDPISTGRMDAYIVEDRHALELFCTGADVSVSDIERKALQVAGYVLEDPDAKRASLIVVDRNTYAYRVEAVNVQGLAAAWYERRNAVVVAHRSGVLPDRVCESKRSGPAFTCAFRERCFADQPPLPPDPIRRVDELAKDLARLYEAEMTAKRSGAEAEAAKRERDEIRAMLLAKGLEPREEIVAGGFTAKYTEVKGRSSFSVEKYRKLGHEVTDAMAQCMKESDASLRWTVEKLP